MQGRPWVEAEEVPRGASVLLTVGLSAEERTLFAAFRDELEAATGVRCLPAATIDGGLGRYSAMRARGAACAALVSASAGEREAFRFLRCLAPPSGLAPVLVLGGRGDERFLAEALAARATDVVLRHELDADRLARSIRIAADLARRDLADERTRLRLREAEELQALVWETVDEALLLVDEAHRVRRANPAAERLLGRPSAELDGAPFSTLGWVSEPHGDVIAEQFGAREIAAQLERPGAERIPVGLKVRPLGRRAGSRERARLIVAQSRAETAEQATLSAEARHYAGLGRFLAAAAHDCGNLLTPLLGYSELLLDRLPDGSPVLGYAHEIERSARLAAELMLRLRDTARSRQVIDAPIRPDRSLHGLAGLLRSLVGRGIELVEELRAGDVEVALRPGELEQVVLNLAANARDAMPLGGRLSMRTRSEPSGHWTLEIEDSGGGITPENLGRLFDPSFTTKAMGKGTGLGLWIVRSIVEQAGGGVTVHSALGRGTTVRVELPVEGRSSDTPA
jgi:signal transduction histidine kinase